MHGLTDSNRQRHLSRIDGVVSSGRGNAAGHIQAQAADLRQLLAMDPFPGSLNVVLDKPVRFEERLALPFDAGERYLWHARLNDQPVWLYRWKGAPLHIVEVISGQKLRDCLHLADGDRINIEIVPEAIAEVTWEERVAWSVVWLGRRSWYYKSNMYRFKTSRYCRRYGAVQTTEFKAAL